MRRHGAGCPGAASTAAGCGLKRGSHREREKCAVSGPRGRPCSLHFSRGSWHPPDPSSAPQGWWTAAPACRRMEGKTAGPWLGVGTGWAALSRAFPWFPWHQLAC